MDDQVTQGSVSSEPSYQAPALVELGQVVELVQGSGSNDTADMKKYYY